jgi:tRNA-splicing ligase RtcB (3'-phosphate/5'-hydroxy nucleic acid ligase)
MKKRELENIGYRSKDLINEALKACTNATKHGLNKSELRIELQSLIKTPEAYKNHTLFGEIAGLLLKPHNKQSDNYLFKQLQYKHWGNQIDEGAHRQMQNACRLPVSLAGALMPDAHVGYGLPIGGVLATENAVIPYAVGVDIACRVMISVFDLSLRQLDEQQGKLKKCLEENTRFGIGARWNTPKFHSVMDENWLVTSVTSQLKDIAWRQLGTSGSGNHFVEFGELELFKNFQGQVPGKYFALVSHSGSRGPGSKVADHYTKLARAQHPDLPSELSHLAWLDMNTEGAEYWEAMELMGRFASANHHVIHKSIQEYLGVELLMQVENHHNYAWKEDYQGKEVIVHRKGATPAGEGVVGYIPGTMVAPGYLVEGLGNEDSLSSCSHGAGRALSRTAAKNSTTMHAMKKTLKENNVELLSAGLDESPHAYKDINAVMKAQETLVKKLGVFQPRIVKMAPEGEKPED